MTKAEAALTKNELEYVYRFRPLERILDKGELERQEVYFASLEQLNDPMEGFLNLYWQGDEIVWRNLLTQYLLCLDRLVALIEIGGDTFNFSAENLDVFSGIDDLPTAKYQQKMADVCQHFFASKQVQTVLNFVGDGERKVTRKEMLFYLTSLHFWAVELIRAANDRHINGASTPLPASPSKKETLSDEFFKAMRAVEAMHDEASALMFEMSSGTTSPSVIRIRSYRRRSGISDR